MNALHLAHKSHGAQRTEAEFSFLSLLGRLSEVSGTEDGATLSVAAQLVREAQQMGELTAWLHQEDASFYAPDMAACGIDLASLVVVRLADAQSIGRAADPLVRSGAFGLLIASLLGTRGRFSNVLMTRLAGLSRKHNVAVVFLTEKTEGRASLGSLIAMRAQTRRLRQGRDGKVRIEVRGIKDKRRAPGWSVEASVVGPPGFL